jgi:hypothetical protein
MPAMANVTGPIAAQAGPSAMSWVISPTMILPDSNSPNPSPIPNGSVKRSMLPAIQ